MTMKKKRRTILIIIIAAVALCILIPVLITAFMGDEPAIYAKYSKLLENGRTYRAIGIDQYVDILEGFESIPGYGDADTLAEETRGIIYDMIVDSLDGSAPESYSSEQIAGYAAKIGGDRDLDEWIRLAEAAELLKSGRAEEAFEAEKALPEKFDRTPIRMALRICESCAEKDWISALDQISAYQAWSLELVDANPSGTVKAGNQTALREKHFRILSDMLSSPASGIAYKAPYSLKFSGEDGTKKAYQSMIDVILPIYRRQAFENGDDLYSLERYPLDPSSSLPDYVADTVSERGKSVRASLEGMDLITAYAYENPVCPVEVTGNGVGVIFISDKGSGSIRFNEGDVMKDLVPVFPSKEAWADDVSSLRYIIRFRESRKQTHEVYYRQNGVITGMGAEYDITTSVVIMDVSAGKTLSHFTYKYSEHNKTGNYREVMNQQILPALRELPAAAH